MAYEQRDDSGSIFRSDRQREGMKDPDYEGSALVGGVAYWVSGWIKKPEGKKAFMSLSFKSKKQERQEKVAPKPQPKHTPPPPPQSYEPGEDPDDLIPF